ncbi:GGDEF domain-containing protein [Streptomyces sp. MS19]|uniref:GGDEF domain-containing protein n=1 Tax=Streptomyces sp. MS19 TaxID=3385972 RepID=UPI0039A3EF00
MSELMSTAAAVVPLLGGWSAHSVLLRRRLVAAQRDPLSGLWRREGFETRAARLLARRPAAVIVIDLDGFKQINDTLGHATGDAVIRMAGASLNESVEGRGFAGRLGGDEFAAAVPLPPHPDALRWLLEGVHGLLTAPIRHGGRDLSVGASVGGASAPPGTPLPAALRAADEAMYQAKQTGGGIMPAHRLNAAYRTVNGRRNGRPGTDLNGEVAA